jgi:exoribonuclease R
MSEETKLDLEFTRLRESLGIPSTFPDAVVEAAEAAAARVPLPAAERAQRADYGFIPFVAIDPAGSRDLDQAFFAQRRGDGFIVLYAIADVGYFVDRGSPIEVEAWRRGQTYYLPDHPTPLYPPSIGENAASLLATVERPCIVFSFDLDHEGREMLVGIERAVIVNRAQLSYEEVGRHLDEERATPGSGELAGREWSASIGLLETIGRLRAALERERGGVSLPIAAQHVSRWAAASHGYRLTFRDPDDVEGWNAQISLMTGMAAAREMVDAKVGLLRVLDAPRFERLEALRITAAALGVSWASDVGYAEFIRSLDPTDPVHAALIYHAASVMGGARYLAFDGALPAHSRHSAVAAYYAHVTAPLRRLADRYVLDLLVELAANRAPDGDVRSALALVAPVVEASERLERRAESTIVNFAESFFLKDRVGEIFDSTIVRLYDDRVTVQIASPPVRADVPLSRFPLDFFEDPVTSDDSTIPAARPFAIALGRELHVRLDDVDTRNGTIHFTPVV